MINWDFCFYYPTGCVCLASVRADGLRAIPKLSFQWQGWSSRQSPDTAAREVQDPIWHSVFSQRRIPKPRAPLGIVPKGSQRCEGPPGRQVGQGVAVAPPGPGDQEESGRDQGGQQSIPTELLQLLQVQSKAIFG